MRVNRIAAVLAACAFAPVVGAQAATFNVNTTADTTTCAATCSLRGAIIASNANQNDADVINVPAGRYVLTLAGPEGDGGETPTPGAPDASVGDLDIRGKVDIEGAGPDLTTVDANGIDRSFAVYGPLFGWAGDATIAGMTITGGRVVGNVNHGGAGIQNRDGGKVLIKNCVITGNTAQGLGTDTAGMFGGGLENVRDTDQNNTTIMTVDHTLVTNNTVRASGLNGAGPRGGGVIAGAGRIFMTDSRIADNTVEATSVGVTEATGGGLASAGGSVTLTRVSITGNRAIAAGAYGGAIGMVGKSHQPYMPAVIAPPTPAVLFSPSSHSSFAGTNVTITGNSASNGTAGGVFFGAAVDAAFDFSTISGNTSPTGSFQITVQSDATGVDHGDPAHEPAGQTYNDSSTLALNRSAVDVVQAPGACELGGNAPATVTGTNNWIVGSTCTGAGGGSRTPSGGALLQPLTGLYGQAMAPGIGSPLLDTVTTGCGTAAGFDARGFTRPQGAGCDIGAGERQPAPTATSKPVITGTVAVGQTLTVDESTFNAAASITTKWQRCQGAACTDIAGQATRQYVIAAGDVGFSLRAIRTAVGADDTSPVDSISDQTTVVPAVTVPPPPVTKVNGYTCTIVGTAGNDNLKGTDGKDVICGLGGNDIISGLGGDDVLLGGSGNDKLYGDKGNDKLFGGTGNDLLYGSVGNDKLWGEAGNDKLYGADGNDKLYGGLGNDNLVGGNGADELWGNGGNDILNARDRAGKDLAVGGAGKDKALLDAKDRSGSVEQRFVVKRVA